LATRASAKSKKARTGKVPSRGKVATLPKSALKAKGKGKKARRALGDNGGPGLTDAQIKAELNRLNRLYSDWEKDRDVAKQSNGVYRSAIKAAKKIGIDTDAYIGARDKDRADHGKIIVQAANEGRYLRIMDSPLATQMDLFQNLNPEEAPPTLDVALQGQMAGKNAEPESNNPYLPGTDDFQIWLENHKIGIGQAADSLRH